YETREGRVARGRLFRSAAFHDATETDVVKLDALGVQFLVDLRRPMERSAEPNKWPGGKARVHVNDEGVADGLPPHLAVLLSSDLSAAATRAYMLGIYRDFASDPRHIQLYSAWFDELTRGGTGVIHCAAGKDRTGLGCALTLLALG